MRVCDWIASTLYDYGVRNIYGLMGGGASGLNDGFIKNNSLRYICFHHEQGAGHAAVGESKYTGKLSVVNPTTGCGGTNCLTSVLNAWQDSVPVLFISGNVRRDQCSRWINKKKDINLRKYGIQEHDIVETVKNMTKYSVFIDDVSCVAYEITKAITIATTGRAGPVWVDVPADIQTALMTNTEAVYQSTDYNETLSDYSSLNEIIDTILQAERPIVLAGQGIKQSNTVEQFKEFVETLKVPYASSYGARDLLPFDHPLNVGAVGVKGSRAGNFAIQASDVLLVLGCSVSTPHIGYSHETWTPFATRILVDIDDNELNKDIVRWDFKLKSDLKDFFTKAKEIYNDR